MFRPGAAANRSLRSRVVLTGPDERAISGISTHVAQLRASNLQGTFRLEHFRVGGEGLTESPGAKLLRHFTTPLAWLRLLLAHGRPICHINTALDARAFTRDAVLLVLARALRCPVVLQVHGGSDPGRARMCPAIRPLLRLLLRLPDRVVVISRDDENGYAAIVGAGRLARIRNSVDAVELAAPPRIRNQGSPLRLVFMGRLIREKGILDVIEAARLLRQSGMLAFGLSIVGDGPIEDEVRASVRRSGLDDVVSILGPVSGTCKNQLLRDADLFVFPTYHRERLPYALLESMAAGVPPITCPTGGIDELVRDGIEGFLVPHRSPDLLAQAIIRLERDRSLLASMSEQCVTRIRSEFSVAQMAMQFERLYQELRSHPDEMSA